jgi:hypothetical protein
MGNVMTNINSNKTLNNNIQKTNTYKKIEKTKFIVRVLENVKSG